ncbi:MAG: hypothetical protein A2149_02315 [Candidatus Schekmanbacteria bacterium RBG_16_38_11]|uniref:EfeO-type cupredoxin-like domain-containing protein n=1 Tax=Candidatus Schekmanbacteria bacterium RBG_16_38_11 TaxID=1817880 RepID=A0A1F7S1B3_9BACT|nr:MAG: hypothetical protein A2149_02315 [Candidatus Schekmanbacteria bacterium RBG_16_38_11]
MELNRRFYNKGSNSYSVIKEEYYYFPFLLDLKCFKSLRGGSIMKKKNLFISLMIILFFVASGIPTHGDAVYKGSRRRTTNGIISVQVTPKRLKLLAWESEDFTTIIKVKGSTSTAVLWKVEGGSGNENGTIVVNDPNSVTYKAPKTVVEKRKVTLVATSVANTSKKGKAVIELTPSIIPDITPGSEVDNTITISNFSFKPANLGVTPGTVITITNEDTVNHSVTSESKKDDFKKGSVNGISFDTGTFILTPQSITIPNDAPVGTVIPYFCTVHRGNMVTPTGYITIILQ